MKKFFKISLIILGILMVLVSFIVTIFISSIMRETKNVKFDKDLLISASKQVNIYDKDDKLINEESFDGKNIVKINELSEDTINCFLSIEDKKFYEHNGLNYKRIAKAMLNNLKSRSFKEGASTISQQLIKNTHLSNEKTIKRKIKEMILTKKLEKSFTKDEILEAYLNVIYFGNGCFGIEEASRFYFDKGAKDLTVCESAVLAGLIKAPATYCPINNYDKSLERRNLVLKEMFEDNNISDEDLYHYLSLPIEIKSSSYKGQVDSLYVSAVKQEAEEILNMSSQQMTLRGYKIYTYLDKESQLNLEASLSNEENYHKNTYGNVADGLGVIIDNNTGGIISFYGNSKYNLLNLKRQPGSAIKPIFVYAPALESGQIYNCSHILDEKIDYNGYSPNNVGNTFHGYVSVRESVADSLNIPAVKIVEYVGIENCKNFARNCGISFNKYDNGYALALGGFNEGVDLIDLTGSYIPFSNNGNYIEPKFIRRIESSDGIVIYERNDFKTKVMGDDTAYLVNDLLIEGVKTGTSKRLKDLDYQVAGKTGTVAIKNTNLNSDTYSIAYTSEHTVGVWLGNYSFDPEYNLEGSNNGGTYCTGIVKETLNGLYSTHKPKDFEKPDSIVSLSIDEKNLNENHTVKLAGEFCPERCQITEIFSNRYKPTEYSDIYSNFDIDFNVEINDNIPTISFNALDYLIYDIYLDDELIKTIDNKSGIYSFEIDRLEANQSYNFQITARCNYSDKLSKSEEKTVYTKNLYEELIDDNPIIPQNNEEQLSWYFYS